MYMKSSLLVRLILFSILFVLLTFIVSVVTGDENNIASQNQYAVAFTPPPGRLCDQPKPSLYDDLGTFYIRHAPIQAPLTIADYKNALEHTYNVQVGKYGWAKPVLANEAVLTQYPVQIVNLGSNYMGYFSPNAGNYTGWVGDNRFTQHINETNATAGCIVLNGDLRWIPNASKRMELLKSTVTQEVNHLIIASYTGGNEDPWWRESVSVYMVEEVDNSFTDHYQTLWPQMDSCLGEYAGNDYSNWLLLRYIAEQNGKTHKAGGGEQVIQKFWEERAVGTLSLRAIESALGSQLKFAQTYHDYGIATRFLKSCQNQPVYCFDEANTYPKNTLPKDQGKIVGIGQQGKYKGVLEDHYATNWVALPRTGIYSVSLKNESAQGVFRVSIVADLGSKLDIQHFPNTVSGNKTEILRQYQPPAGAKEVVAIITNEYAPSGDPSSCAANPYTLTIAPPIAWAIDVSGSMEDELARIKSGLKDKIDEDEEQGFNPTRTLITYRDNVNYKGTTADSAEMKGWINSLQASDGGDPSEHTLGALNAVAKHAPNSVAVALTDASFHGDIGDFFATVRKLVNANVKASIGWYHITTREGAGSESSLVDSPLEYYARIAHETGGNFFRVPDGKTSEFFSILSSKSESPYEIEKILDLNAPWSKTHSFPIDSTNKFSVLFNGITHGTSSFELYDPNGMLVDETYPDVNIISFGYTILYEVSNPIIGDWEVQIEIAKIGKDMFELSVFTDEPNHLGYLGDTILLRDVPVPFQASLSGDYSSVEFFLTDLDGSNPQEVEMFDDGLHDDGEANDGVFGAMYTPSQTGSYHLKVEGSTSDNIAFQRVAAPVFHVFGVDASPSLSKQIALPGSDLEYEVTLDNVSQLTNTYTVSVVSARGWEHLAEIPTEVTLEAYQSIVIPINVTIPTSAEHDDKDSLILTFADKDEPLSKTEVTLETVAATKNDIQVTLTGGEPTDTAPDLLHYHAAIRSGDIDANNVLFTSTLYAEDATSQPYVWLILQGTVFECTTSGSVMNCPVGRLGANIYMGIDMFVKAPDSYSRITHDVLVTADEEDPDASNNAASIVIGEPVVSPPPFCEDSNADDCYQVFIPIVMCRPLPFVTPLPYPCQ